MGKEDQIRRIRHRSESRGKQEEGGGSGEEKGDGVGRAADFSLAEGKNKGESGRSG